jgi:hypothetical protein
MTRRAFFGLLTGSNMTPRRFYLLKRLALRAQGDRATEGIWRAKQEAIAGTSLDATFPHLTALAAIGYSTTEDLEDATETELIDAGLTRRQARAVLAALE